MNVNQNLSQFTQNKTFYTFYVTVFYCSNVLVCMTFTTFLLRYKRFNIFLSPNDGRPPAQCGSVVETQLRDVCVRSFESLAPDRVLMSKLISSGTTTKQTFHDSPRWDERFLRGQTARLALMSAWFSLWRRGWSPANLKIFPCEVYCSFGRCYHFNVSSHNNGNRVVLKRKSVNVMALWPTWTENVFEVFGFGHESKGWKPQITFTR